MSTVNPSRVNGIFQGFVEWNKDPLKKQRCIVRIPTFHGFVENVPDGEEIGIATEKIQWARRCNIFPGANDKGDALVPEIGDAVFVFFEAGDPTKPVYFGGVHYEKGNTRYGSPQPDGSVFPEVKQEKGSTIHGFSFNKSGQEAPLEFTAASDKTIKVKSEGDRQDEYPNGDPDIEGFERLKPKEFDVPEARAKVLYKSVKGATILEMVADEEEKFTFFDRLGNIMSWFSPVKKTKNAENQSRREDKNIVDDTALGYEETLKDQCIWLLKFFTKSLIRFTVKKGKELLEIVNQDQGGEKSQLSDVFDATEGAVVRTILVNDKNNASKISLLMDASSGKFEIVMTHEGVVKQRFTMDKGDFTHQSLDSQTHKSKTLTLEHENSISAETKNLTMKTETASITANNSLDLAGDQSAKLSSKQSVTIVGEQSLNMSANTFSLIGASSGTVFGSSLSINQTALSPQWIPGGSSGSVGTATDASDPVYANDLGSDNLEYSDPAPETSYSGDPVEGTE